MKEKMLFKTKEMKRTITLRHKKRKRLLRCLDDLKKQARARIRKGGPRDYKFLEITETMELVKARLHGLKLKQIT